MKKNLLIAAAITAILSGCGGGDGDSETTTIDAPKKPSNDVVTKADVPVDVVKPVVAPIAFIAPAKPLTAPKQRPVPQATPQLALIQGVSNEHIIKSKQGKPAIPVAKVQDTPEIQNVPVRSPIATPIATPVPNKTLETQVFKLDPMAEFSEYAQSKGLVDTEGTNQAAIIALRDRMNTSIENGNEVAGSLAAAKRGLDYLAAPTVVDNNQTPTLVTTSIDVAPVPTKQLQSIPTSLDSRVTQEGKADPMGEFYEYAQSKGLVDTEGTNQAAIIALRDRMNTSIENGNEVAGSLAAAKRGLDYLAAPTVVDNNQTPTPYAVPTTQENSVPELVKVTQRIPEFPVVKDQGTPNVVPAEMEQGTPTVQRAPLQEVLNAPTVEVVSQNDPIATQANSFKKAKWEAQKEDSFIRNGYAQEGWVTSVGTLPSELVDAPAAVASKYTEKTPSLDVNFGEIPHKIAQGEPGAPLISGESRKERKLPSAKPSVVDINVPVANVVSQNDPIATQANSFKKAKWEAQKEDSFIRNGYAQEGWVTSVGTLPSELVDMQPVPKQVDYQTPEMNIELGTTPPATPKAMPEEVQVAPTANLQGVPEIPKAIEQGIPVTTIDGPDVPAQLTITPKDTFTFVGDGTVAVDYQLDVHQQGLIVPDDADPYLTPEAPELVAPSLVVGVNLTPEVIKDQTAFIAENCLVNLDNFVSANGGLNTLGGLDFQRRTDVGSLPEVDQLGYAIEVFSLLQEYLTETGNFVATANAHAGNSKNSHTKEQWTVDASNGTYELSTDVNIDHADFTVQLDGTSGEFILLDSNGIEFARVSSSGTAGNCDGAELEIRLTN